MIIIYDNIKFAHSCTVYVGLAQARPNDQTQIHGQTKVMVIFPIYGQTCSKYMVKIQENPLT